MTRTFQSARRQRIGKRDFKSFNSGKPSLLNAVARILSWSMNSLHR